MYQLGQVGMLNDLSVGLFGPVRELCACEQSYAKCVILVVKSHYSRLIYPSLIETMLL
jgi:hypothetical protein